MAPDPKEPASQPFPPPCLCFSSEPFPAQQPPAALQETPSSAPLSPVAEVYTVSGPAWTWRTAHALTRTLDPVPLAL